MDLKPPIIYQVIYPMDKKFSKVVFLGDSAVGKTSILRAYFDSKFLEQYKATVGVDFMQKKVLVEGRVIKIQTRDTSGQQKFKSLAAAFYRGADCCVLVYDTTKKRSFDNIQSWISEFLSHGAPKEPEKFPFVLVGNKIDCQEEAEVGDSSVQQFLAKYPRIQHLMTSAKNREGVEIAFQKIALASIQNKQEQTVIPIEANSFRLNKDKQKKKGCC